MPVITDARKASRLFKNLKGKELPKKLFPFFCPWCRQEHHMLLNELVYQGVTHPGRKMLGVRKLPGATCDACLEDSDGYDLPRRKK